MALRAFIPTVQFTPDGGAHIEGPAFDNGVIVNTPSGILGEGNVAITDAMTPVQIKAALEASYRATFEQRTGRSDGGTITFVWL